MLVSWVGGRGGFGSFLNASILLAVYYRHSSTILCYNEKENNLHCSAKIHFFRFGTMLDEVCCITNFLTQQVGINACIFPVQASACPSELREGVSFSKILFAFQYYHAACPRIRIGSYGVRRLRLHLRPQKRRGVSFSGSSTPLRKLQIHSKSVKWHPKSWRTGFSLI